MADLNLKGVLGLDSSKFTKGANDASKSVDKLAGEAARAKSPMDLLGVAAGAVAAGGLLALGQRAVSAAWDLGQLGAGIMQTRDRLQELAAGAGGSADAIIAAINRASAGTVQESETILLANRGIMLGLGANAEQWEQLAEVARYRAQAMGLSMSQALNDITTGIGRESALILDNLGIVLDLEQAMQTYAGTVGKTAEELSAAERKQALLNSVIQTGQKQIQEVGGISLTSAEKFQQLETASGNLKAAIGEALAPALADAATGLTGVVQAAMGAEDELQALTDAALRSGQAVTGAFGAFAYFNKEALAAAAAFDPGPPNNWSVAVGGATKQTEALEKALKLVQERNRGVAATAILGENLASRGAFGGRPEIQEQFLEQAKDREEEAAEAAEDAAQRATRAWEDSLKAREDAYDNLRSTIKSALSATSVTAFDMGLSDSGQYVDKWDENARRLDAIAQRGFAELQAHADWGSVLKIPPEVIAAGESALKEWAGNVAGDVRDLSRPDLLNLDAAVAAVRAYMGKQEAIELSIDMVAAKMAEGGTGPSKEDIAVALGLQTASVDVPINLISDAKEGEDASIEGAGAQLARQLKTGVGTELKEAGMVGVFLEKFNLDISNSGEPLRNAGALLWQTVEPGIRGALKKTSWVREFAMHMAPYVADILQARGQI